MNFKRISTLSVIGFSVTLGLSNTTIAHAQNQYIKLLQPRVQHSCGQKPYSPPNSPDIYMQANGSKNCNTVVWDAIPLSLPCDFYAMNPDHGGKYKGTSNAYYGIFNNQGAKKVVIIAPAPTNTWQLLGTFSTSPSILYKQAVHFEVGDNNGSSGIIGMGQIKQVCPSGSQA